MYILLINTAISIVSVILIIMILSQSFEIKRAYVYGKKLEEQCQGEYFESERAEYIAYKTYIENVEQTFKNVFYILVGYFILLVIGVFILIIAATFDNLDNYLYINILTIVGSLLLGYVITSSTEKKKSSLYALIVLLVPIILGLLLSFEKVRSTLKITKLTDYYYIPIIILLIPIILVGIFIILLWINGVVPKKFMKNFVSISPFDITSSLTNYASAVFSHFVSIIILFATVTLYYKFNGIVINSFKEFINIIIPIIIISIIVLILVGFVIFFYSADFNMIKNKYETDTEELNTIINNELTNNNTILKNYILKNIIIMDDKEFTIPEIEDYKDELFKYIKHSENSVDLQKIIISDNLKYELKKYIKEENLNGEGIIDLKHALVKFYQLKNGIPYNINLANNYYNINPNNNSYDRALDSLKTYFTSEFGSILLKTNITNTDELTMKKEFLTLLNNYFITNNYFTSINILPEEITNNMTALREDKIFKSKIDSFYNLTKILFYIILFTILLIGYNLLVYIYPGNAIKYLSLAMIALIFIIFYLGFLIKDAWI
jgi:ABC-type multidrug transport system fused ATPase/permease subunit